VQSLAPSTFFREIDGDEEHIIDYEVRSIASILTNLSGTSAPRDADKLVLSLGGRFSDDRRISMGRGYERYPPYFTEYNHELLSCDGSTKINTLYTLYSSTTVSHGISMLPGTYHKISISGRCGHRVVIFIKVPELEKRANYPRNIGHMVRVDTELHTLMVLNNKEIKTFSGTCSNLVKYEDCGSSHSYHGQTDLVPYSYYYHVLRFLAGDILYSPLAANHSELYDSFFLDGPHPKY